METLLQWEALEHHHQEKNTDWFWAVGIISVAIAATAIILNNVVFAILILVAAFALIIHAVRPPRTLRISIEKDGIMIDRYKYPYASLDSFWINEHAHSHELLLKSQRFFMPLVVIRLEKIMTQEVRTALSGLLKEEEHHEPLLQKLMEYLGF